MVLDGIKLEDDIVKKVLEKQNKVSTQPCDKALVTYLHYKF